MLYKRSSFLTFLKKKYDCDIKIMDSKAIRIKYGNELFYMVTNKADIIDYEEIYICYNRLLLPDLPGDKDLERVE